MGREAVEGCCSPFHNGAGSQRNNVTWAKACLHTKCHLDLSSRLATPDMGRKWWSCALFGGDLGPHVTQCGLGRVLPLYQLESCSTQTFCHNRHRPKNRGGCCALFGGWGGAGSQSNTTLPELRPTSVSSGILIYLAIWPQWTWTENGGGGAVPFLGEELVPHPT